MDRAILVVEDEAAAGEMLLDVLKDAGYADVRLASDGLTALALLRQHTFAVVVSDIHVPGADGIEVLQAARQGNAASEVILITGYGALDTSLAALRKGAFDYLLKPCAPDVLLERVQHALEVRNARLRQDHAIRSLVHEFSDMVNGNGNGNGNDRNDGNGNTPSPPEAAYEQHPHTSHDHEQMMQAGALCIGNHHSIASLDGKPLHLTPKEYAVLRCLICHPDRLISYRELVYHAYGYDISSIEARILLKTHVRNLRKKLGADYLVNVRGTGYKLVVP